MTGFKPTMAWWGFARGVETPEALIKTVAEIGYAGIEMAGEEFWPLIADAGLEIASERAHDSLGNGLNRRENHDRIEREVHANLAIAHQWQMPTLICFSGNRDGLDDETGAHNTAEGLRRVAKAAEDAGVTLALELLNSKVNHPDYQCDRTAWGVKVVEWVDSPRVKLLYDIYHMQIMEGDLIRTIQAHHAHFGHYHVAGNPGRHEPDDSQEINYPAVYLAIRATGFTGPVGMEFTPTGDPITALREAFALTQIV
ncbi:MAG: hydroxypyruvate isomerase family protein [Thermomicrobiales bacterium]